VEGLAAGIAVAAGHGDAAVLGGLLGHGFVSLCLGRTRPAARGDGAELDEGHVTPGR